MAIGMLGLLILPLLALLLLRPIWLVVVPPRDLVREASCGRCRYAVEGLTTNICPECGSDLHDVGVVTRRMQIEGRGSVPLAIVCWILLCTGAAFIAAGVATRFASGLTVVTTFNQTYSLRAPASRLYRGIDIQFDASDQGGTVHGTATIELTTIDGARHLLTVNANDLTISNGGSNLSRGALLDESTFADWVREAIGAEASPALAIEVGAAFDLVETLSLTPRAASFSGQGFSSTGVTSSTGSRTMRAERPWLIVAQALTVVLYLGATVGGSLLIARRRRALLQPAR